MMEIIRSLRKDRIIFLILYMVVAVWTLPSSIIFPSAGLDHSWIIGINWAFLKDFQFGKDIIFTHGPLGFLYFPYLFDYNLWLTSLIFNIFVHFLFFLSLLVLVYRLNVQNYKHILLLFALIVVLPMWLSVEYKLVLTGVLLLYLSTLSNLSAIKNIFIISIVSFLFAISSFIKFNALIMSLGTITVFVIYIIASKNKNYNIRLVLPSILLSYILFLLFLGLVAKQDIFSVLQYINRGFEYSSGYVEAMAIEGPQWQLLVGVISLFIFFMLILYSLIRKNSSLFIFLLLSVTFIFASFRHGFIRHDLHALIFFASSSIVLVLALMIPKQDVGNVRYKFLDKFSVFANISIIIILILSIFVTQPEILNSNIASQYTSIKQSISFIGNRELFDEVKQDNKEEIKKAYPMTDEIVEQIKKNNTVDIFPWDIALLYAYDMNWDPRPMPQSITAYTKGFDKLNAMHFLGNNSPDTLLYAFKSIDGRYPIFDEPETFRNILLKYIYLNRSGEFLLLTQDTRTKNFEEKDLGTTRAEIGQTISVPEYNEGYIFGFIDVEYSLIGKMSKVIFKPSLLYIQFKFKDNTYSQKFRLIPDTAKDGVFLSQYVGNLNDLASIFKGYTTRDITGIIIDTDSQLYYSKYVKVRFVGIGGQNSSLEQGFN